MLIELEHQHIQMLELFLEIQKIINQNMYRKKLNELTYLSNMLIELLVHCNKEHHGLWLSANKPVNH